MVRRATALPFVLLMAATVAATLAAANTSAGAGVALPAPAPAPGKIQSTRLTSQGRQLLGRTRWLSTRYVTATGESVKVNVSPAYAADPGAAQRWSIFFASLIHGAELALLDAYVAPLDEVQAICRAEAFGCYGLNHLVTMGEANQGVSAESVATHEYGHHIAANRINPPWLALDWGTKRWASSVDVCSRVGAGMAFPGDEGLNYSFNPAEAYAESYRVLIETGGSALGYEWPIVDPSFRPSAESLAAIREDVLHPWTGPRTRLIRSAFLRQSHTWSTQIATPLDGELRLRLTVPGGGADDVTLLSSDGGTVLATSSWDMSGGKSVGYRICGVRFVKVRVTRGGPPARFSLRVTAP